MLYRWNWAQSQWLIYLVMYSEDVRKIQRINISSQVSIDLKALVIQYDKY